MENKYQPVSAENVQRLREVLERVTSHLPEAEAPFIWNMYNDTRGTNERQPCTCGSAGRYWGEAITHLRNWLKEKDGSNG